MKKTTCVPECDKVCSRASHRPRPTERPKNVQKLLLSIAPEYKKSSLQGDNE